MEIKINVNFQKGEIVYLRSNISQFDNSDDCDSLQARIVIGYAVIDNNEPTYILKGENKFYKSDELFSKEDATIILKHNLNKLIDNFVNKEENHV